MSQAPLPPPSSPDYTRPLPPPARPPRPPRGRTGLTAAVLAGSLVVGGVAGLGGAAVWDATHADEGTSLTTAQAPPVSDAPAAAAPAGSVERVAQQVLPSVVRLDVSGPGGAGSGSGIVLSSDGRILTNDHVVELAGDGGQITVSFDDGTKATARVLGTDPLTDTAVIQAEDATGLSPATIGRSADLAVGEQVVAVGSPFGLDSTVTTGIVSALNRPVDVGRTTDGNATTYPAIQTDAAINPGNSGGPLVDMTGRVVGINSSIYSPASGAGEAGSVGVGFAIPIDAVMPIVEQMSNGQTPTHARLGISVSDASTGSGADAVEGAAVERVEGGSTADRAGLQAGDVITHVGDTTITDADSLVATIRSHRPGDEVAVTYLRGGDTRTVTLTLDSDAP